MVATAPDETSAERRLRELQSIYGMPDGCALSETFLQRTTIGQLELSMVGLIATARDGSSVTGAAAAEEGFPVDRAFFELIERLSIFLARQSPAPLRVRDAQGRPKGERSVARVFPADEKPDSLRTSVSNGVALHASWDLACEAAVCELVERDRVLRSFAGEHAPQKLDYTDPALSRALRGVYRLEAYAFGPKRPKLSRVATGVFLFPEQSEAPLVYGFGAGLEVAAALGSATREALQRLAFLWGEPLPSAPPEAAPTPDYHQEFYLFPKHHSLLHDWLAGKRKRAAARSRMTKPFDAQAVAYVDLAPPGVQGDLAVAKAVSSRARVLRFGIAARTSRNSKPSPHPIA